MWQWQTYEYLSVTFNNNRCEIKSKRRSVGDRRYGVELGVVKSAKVHNITTRFLFELFPSVQTVVIVQDDGSREKQTVGIEQWQKLAVEALGTRPDAFKPVMSKAG